ncbi:MAG: inositol monophosphatase family protein [Nocardioidaceae bacterium]|nr:inositol monophosphatase family protein [Nocardioidaceae bacterium]
MPSASTSDVEVAVAAATAGAEVLRSLYGGALTRFAKAGDDFATDADLGAEQAIRSVIASAYPDDAFLGEEGGLTGAADAQRTWLVDPLCGTRNFAAATPLAGVNVALRTGDGLTAAAVADPFTGEVFSTGDALAPTALSGLVDVDFDGRPGWAAAMVATEEFHSRFGLRVSSTSLALAWVATGRRAGYVHAGDVRDSVHFAAGMALCRTAGCVVTDLAGRPVAESADGLVAAADADTHAALLDAIAGIPR